MTKIISVVKKSVTVFNLDLLYPRLKQSKPEFIPIQKQKADPAGNTMSRVYRDGISRGPMF
jgi:hypothetical protein